MVEKDLFRSALELVAHSMGGEDVEGVTRVWFELSPQRSDEIIDGSVRSLIVPAPHVVEDFFAGPGPSGSTRKKEEQIELLG